jgi:hypothetical protein
MLEILNNCPAWVIGVAAVALMGLIKWMERKGWA